MGKQTRSTRQVILSLIKRHKERTVSDIANELGITEMAVRRHLQGLETEGLIQARLEKQSMGRPSYKYYLTESGEESFPRNYGALSLEFLKDLESLNGNQVIEELFEKRRERLEDKYKEIVQGSLEERIAALAKIQDENGYMVEWEQAADGDYRFIEYNCPIAKVAKDYHIACSCEKKLFKNLLNTDHVVRETCAAKDNHAACVYTIKNA
ncbi:helix-turn-helix transcriptional regulator [Alkalihalobacillus pseudalcaliphilus]|uniref:helix-turn-helix transcriptional regulator n=1 Tax=Alkalihalobacillus pseudalcaliphilus TaxID=79884 RepID=UPI00064DBE8E|nr:metalloregulator ArsR/SmtB family transcription factor [Alkalihalobacillus pseudalcaliphilus]KMK77654.1 transcriptional regulator [Alkalihalobacillus pseudalcaliphilus]